MDENGTEFDSIPMGSPSNDNETEDGVPRAGGSPEHSIEILRRDFMFASYFSQSILSAVTIGIASLLMFQPTIKAWTLENHGMFYAALGIASVLYVSIYCFKFASCKEPLKLTGNAVLSIVLGIALGTYFMTFPSQNVFMLYFIVCELITIALTLYSRYTNWDFIFKGGIVLSGVITLIVFGGLLMFAREIFSTLEIGGTCGVALVCSALDFRATIKQVNEVAQKRLEELCGKEDV